MGKFWNRNTAAAKLTPTKVLEIREKYSNGATQSSLCKEYDVSIVQIGRVVRGEVWQSVIPPPTADDLYASAQRMFDVQNSMGTAVEKEVERNKLGDTMLNELKGESK